MVADIGRRTVMKVFGVATLAGFASDSASAESGGTSTLRARRGSLRQSRFEVELEIGGQPITDWRTVQLPSVTIEATNAAGEGEQQHRKLWGQSEYEDLKMERGAKKGDTALYDWHRQVQESDAPTGDILKPIAVNVMDSTGETAARWEFTKAWPKVYEPPDLDATAEGGDLATETVVIVYDEMKRTK